MFLHSEVLILKNDQDLLQIRGYRIISIYGTYGIFCQFTALVNPAEVGNILTWKLIMKYCLRSFSPLIQEGQLSVSGERMCSILVNRLED